MTDDRIQRIREGIAENRHAPNGALRCARAEELVAGAEATGDTGLLLEALSQLITAYEYSSERGKMFVPFTRMLGMWDEDPSRFDDRMAYELFWRFKWVTGSMIDYPEIPLASVEQWLGEMERRYREAGYAARTVHCEEFHVARHVGDLARAQAAFDRWTAGERDRMSNCHACEATGQGNWEAFQGRDEAALERWEPVLAGQLSCAEEPHRALSYSLLPLLRIGRTDQARGNHLRGYRMARGNESLLPTVARHVEFCALTGNEARGLEILAEHARHLDGTGNPDSALSLMEAAILLLDRLQLLGLGERTTSGPQGGSWTVATLRAHCERLRAELAARFDRRNGNGYVSAESLKRLAQQPLLDRLPLGVSAVLPGAAPRPAPAPAAPAIPVETPFEELVAEARRLRGLGHPTARRHWLAVEERLGGEAPADDLLRADLAAQRGIRSTAEDAGAAGRCFEEAATAYRAAGQPGEALVNDARAALADALADRPDRARQRADAAVAAARSAEQSGAATVRQLAVVLLCRAKVLAHLGREQPDEPLIALARAALDEVTEVAGVEAVEEGVSPEARRLMVLVADAAHVRASLAGEDFELVVTELRGSADAYLLADQPWSAAGPLVPLARLRAQHGDHEVARATAEEALRLGGDRLDPGEAGVLHLLLADLTAHRNEHDHAVRHALEAARMLDEAGQSAGPGAAARHRLALSYRALGRHAEAAEVLQSALPELLAHGEGPAVAARRALGESLTQLREHAAAAEQFALAAQVVEGWGERVPIAQLASLTAEALGAAGRGEEAEAAYRRARGLWAAAGVPGMVVRTVRALAWQSFRHGRSADPGRELMLEAAETARAALAAPDLDPAAAAELRGELADTWRQLAALLFDVAEDEGWNGATLAPGVAPALIAEALDHYLLAAEGFAGSGERFAGHRVRALLDVARMRVQSEQYEAASAQLKEVLELAAEHGDRSAGTARQAQSMLDWLERRAG